MRNLTTIDPVSIKHTLFADDGTFMTDGSRKSFHTLIETLDNFALTSGLKLNTKNAMPYERVLLNIAI